MGDDKLKGNFIVHIYLATPYLRRFQTDTYKKCALQKFTVNPDRQPLDINTIIRYNYTMNILFFILVILALCFCMDVILWLLKFALGVFVILLSASAVLFVVYWIADTFGA